ncbi:sodium:solute symporter family protein [Poriferisphaera sp. WC338]|uniref:sodium:solute symporter family protein n=1 Tax=Poriferisphaera sp. WC338 TaxID=3425129 RepID=UPI003D817AE8
MNLHWIDLSIVGGFFLFLIVITLYTKRKVKSVAGFLSAERVAGRYMLTMAGAMAFVCTIGMVGAMEGHVANGFGGLWWMLMLMPLQAIVALSGWVTYRYRETRAMTLPQLMEMRYSHHFRVFCGVLAFIAGALNCGVFPMVTARFMIYFCGLPHYFDLVGYTDVTGWQASTYVVLVFFEVVLGVVLAIAGGQITVMVTDFFAGLLTNVTLMIVILLIFIVVGWDGFLDSLMNIANTIGERASELEYVPKSVENAVANDREVSYFHPFKQRDIGPFGVWFFVINAALFFFNRGTWQGDAGYQTAAKTPHEARMAGILSQWRIHISRITMAVLGAFALIYLFDQTLELRNAAAAYQEVAGIGEEFIRSQMTTPVVLGKFLPVGIMGLFLVFMIYSTVSTDDSAFHSWGSILQQDVMMPFRKKPMTPKQHLFWLRVCIVLVGAFVFLFSCIWSMKEFINMWFAITMAIFVGGAGITLIGGLYWSRGTTQGAWAGMITGSTLSISQITMTYLVREVGWMPWLKDYIPHGLLMSLFVTIIAGLVYVVVSLLTCKQPHDMDKLLNRGKYAVGGDHEALSKAEDKRPWLEKVLKITSEFTLRDKIVYYGQFVWVFGWGVVFVIGSTYNWTYEAWYGEKVSDTAWRWWFEIHIGVLLLAFIVVTIWFTLGGIRDMMRMFHDLNQVEVNPDDDGSIKSQIEEPELTASK